MSDPAPQPSVSLKSCFVIGPIGAENSPERDRADYLLELIIKPTLSDSYSVTRADAIAEPGTINRQIIAAMLDSDLVIADLTDSNANAFYELGIRHSVTAKPVIHMAPGDEIDRLPFDVKPWRTVPYRLKNPRHIDEAKAALRAVVDAVNKADFVPVTPVGEVLGLKKLAQSNKPEDLQMLQAVEIREELTALRDEVARLQRFIRSTVPRTVQVPVYNPSHTFTTAGGATVVSPSVTVEALHSSYPPETSIGNVVAIEVGPQRGSTMSDLFPQSRPNAT